MSPDLTDLTYDDTIAAIITPPGEGGIAALRLAGPKSREIASKFFRGASGEQIHLEPFHLRFGFFRDAAGSVLDEVTAVAMPQGHSYTGLEQVEIFCHGGRVVVRRILETILSAGARPAEPGEFTKLAFLNGRIDLARAEAVAEMIAANTEVSYVISREHLLGAYSEHIGLLRERLVGVLAEIEASIDFPEEEIAPATQQQLVDSIDEIMGQIQRLSDSYKGGRIINEGFRVAIGGRPNAGKSSLFNLLLRQERALVNPTAGTTRDYLSEWIELGGFGVNLTDTAGLRQHGGEIEKAGMERARKIIEDADLVLWLVDISKRNWRSVLARDLTDLPQQKTIVLGNKTDLLEALPKANGREIHFISCQTEFGMTELKSRLVGEIEARMPDRTSGLVVTSARHRQKLEAALAALQSVHEKILAQDSPEVIAFDLQAATSQLDEITGRVYTEEILGRVFGKFCIGK